MHVKVSKKDFWKICDMQKMCDEVQPYLDTIDFQAVPRKNGIKLIDTNGYNYDNIEKERFNSIGDILSALSNYWSDFYLNNGSEEFDSYGQARKWYMENDHESMAESIDDFALFYKTHVGFSPCGRFE